MASGDGKFFRVSTVEHFRNSLGRRASFALGAERFTNLAVQTFRICLDRAFFRLGCLFCFCFGRSDCFGRHNQSAEAEESRNTGDCSGWPKKSHFSLHLRVSRSRPPYAIARWGQSKGHPDRGAVLSQDREELLLVKLVRGTAASSRQTRHCELSEGGLPWRFDEHLL